MNLKSLAGIYLDQIFTILPTSSLTLLGNVYTVVTSDIVKQTELQAEGFYVEPDVTIYLKTNDYPTEPTNKTTITLDSKNYRINKVTKSSDGNKWVIQAGGLIK